MIKRDDRNLSRKKREKRQARREKIQKKMDGIREKLLHTRKLERDYKGHNIVGWTLDENDNPVRV